jgi:hypothetical protein
MKLVFEFSSQHPNTEALLSTVPVPYRRCAPADHFEARRVEPDRPALGLPLSHPPPHALERYGKRGAGTARGAPRLLAPASGATPRLEPPRLAPAPLSDRIALFVGSIALIGIRPAAEAICATA